MDDWMRQLKAGVDAGYYRPDGAEEEKLTPLSALFPPLTPERWNLEKPWRINLESASVGWLQSPDGTEERFVPGLAAIAEDIRVKGITVYWDRRLDAEPSRNYISYYTSKRIALNPELYDESRYWIRYMLGSAFAHCMLGNNDFQQAGEWSYNRYGTVCPRGREILSLSLPTSCHELLADVAKVYGWGPEDAAAIIFFRGLADYADDRRRRSGKLGLDATPAEDEQRRILRMYRPRKGA